MGRRRLPNCSLDLMGFFFFSMLLSSSPSCNDKNKLENKETGKVDIEVGMEVEEKEKAEKVETEEKSGEDGERSKKGEKREKRHKQESYVK